MMRKTVADGQYDAAMQKLCRPSCCDCCRQTNDKIRCKENEQEGLAVASIARDVVVEMTPPREDNAR